MTFQLWVLHTLAPRVADVNSRSSLRLRYHVTVSFTSIWNLVVDSVTRTDTASTVALVAALALAASVALVPSLRTGPVRHVSALVHELGHATVATALGMKVRGVRIGTNGGGHTSYLTSRRRGLRLILAVSAGYPAPAVLAAALMSLVAAGRTRLALILVLVTLVMFLVRVRGWLTLAVTVACSGVVAASWVAPPALAQAFTVTLACLLVVGAWDTWFDVVTVADTDLTQDPGQLSRLTHLPPKACAYMLAAVTTVATSWVLACLTRIALA